jgi:RNA polymerase sigma-70 factor (ECF subfamily)
MPPIPGWLRGRDAFARHLRGPGADCRGSRLLRTRANGLPAFASYRPARDGTYHPFAMQLIEIGGGSITALHTFVDPRLFPLFDLPSCLPAST